MSADGEDIEYHDGAEVIARYGIPSEDGNIVAYLELSDYQDGYVYLALVVLPEYRGKHFASDLMKQAENYAKAHHYSTIRYVANKRNIQSQKFIDKFSDYKLAFDTLDCYVYEKNI